MIRKIHCAWDTSSSRLQLVLFQSDPFQIISADVEEGSVKKSEKLLRVLDEQLKKNHLKLSDLSSLSVGVGPGSFTGLRVGLMIANTLSKTLAIPLYPLRSTQAKTKEISDLKIYSGPKGMVLVTAFGAAKGECYFSTQTRDSFSEESLSFQDAKKKILDLESKKVIFFGDELRETQTLREEVFSHLAEDVSHKFSLENFSNSLALFASESFLQQSPSKNWVQPLYLRSSEAEKKLNLGLLPPGPTRGV